MKPNRILVIFFIIAIAVNVLCLRKGLGYRNICKQQHNVIETQEDYKLRLNQLASSISLIYSNCDFELSQQMIISNENGDKIKVVDLLSSGGKLIFRYNRLSCMACVDKELKKIDSLAKEVGEDNIIILAAYDSNRDLHAYKRLNNIDLSMYNCPMGTLPNSIENENVPYLFYVNEDFTIQDIFIPQRDIPSLTDLYYKSILRKIKKNDK